MIRVSGLNIPAFATSALRCAAILAFAVLFCACHADPREQRRKEGEAIISIGGGDPRTLDPSLCTDVPSAACINLFMRGLTMLEDDGKTRLELAESIEASPDGKTYDVKIRKSSWSNGEPVTADDFIYAALDRMLNPKFGAEYAYFLFCLEGAQDYHSGKSSDRSKVGIEAVAPDHLRYHLVAPTPYFPVLLQHHAFYPICKSVAEKNPKWALDPSTYVGNGPFKMTYYSTGDKIGGVKNEGYWNAANVALNKISLRFIEEEPTERIAFENHEIDGTTAAPRPDIDALKAEGNLRFAPVIGTYFFFFNMKIPLFQDVRVRRALSLAIDRAEITRSVTRANEKPALGFVPPELYTGLPPKEYLKDADYAEAKKLLAEAGYPDGKGFPTIHYLYNTMENHRAIAQVIQEGWKKQLGIEMVPQNTEFKVLMNKRRGGDFELARGSWIADFTDPINFLEMFLSESGNNDSHFVDPKYDAMIEAARIEADPIKRMALLRGAEDYFMDQAPVLPIYYYSIPYLTAPGLEGYTLTPMHSFDAAKIRWKS